MRPAFRAMPKQAFGGLNASWTPSLIVRFAGGGLLNTAFGYIVFVILLKIGMPLAAALVGTTFSGILFNFQTSRRIVFQSRQTGLLLRFAGVYLVLFCLNWAAIAFLRRYGFQNWSAQAVLVIPMASVAFLAQKNLVFRQDREPS